MASKGVHGQLVSSISSTSGPTASRAARTEATSVWWSFSIRKPCATKCRQAPAQGPAQQLVDRRAAHLAEQVPQRDLDAADREHPEPTPPVDHGPAMHQ